MLQNRARGFTLIELVITVAVLAILTLGVIPLVQVSVKRQKEDQLRAALREMREAIDQFHREALASPQVQTSIPGGEPNPRNPTPLPSDPRIRVYISDPTIFSTDNPDRYPPDLKTLVNGVDVLPFAMASQLTGGQGITGPGIIERSENSIVPKTKFYLRQIPIDPMTGKAEWGLRSCYDRADATSWGGENVFNVYSLSDGTALNREKYRDW
jgi:general secretion pathway protein G